MKSVYILQRFYKDGELPHIGSIVGAYTSKDALLNHFPKSLKISDEFGIIVGRKEVKEYGIYNNAIIKVSSDEWNDELITIPSTTCYFHIVETLLNH
jgi:hypothetical protein